MRRNGRNAKRSRSQKAGPGRAHRETQATGPSSERALLVWRTIHDRVLRQQTDMHLQGLYAELGKLYFEHMRGDGRPGQEARRQVEELSARISAFRRQHARPGPRTGPAKGRRPARRRGGTA